MSTRDLINQKILELSNIVNQDPKSVLLVEDQVLARNTAARLLIRLDYLVTPCNNAVNALAMIASGKTFDILFADINLPGEMNGLSLAQNLHSKFPNMKILLTSGNPPADDNALSEIGASIILKPYHKDDLQQALDAYFGI
jgi:CheY-like chemotaxis protein